MFQIKSNSLIFGNYEFSINFSQLEAFIVRFCFLHFKQQSFAMMSFRIFLGIAAAIVSTWASIPYTDVKVNIFDSRPRDFENSILNLMNNSHQFYKEHNVTSPIDSLAETLAEHTPYVKELIKTVTDFHKTMAEKSEWRVLFTKAIKDQTLLDIAEDEERRMKSMMETVESKIGTLGDGNPDKSNRKTIASILHTELDKMINAFDLKSALPRKYPLMGAPPLIQLANLVAIFMPYAKALNPVEAMNPQISCKIRDVLLDYRPRAVNARLHQLYANTSIFESKVKVMQMPFNEHGYNRTNPGSIDCARKPDDTQSNAFWLKDEFGADEFWVNKNDSTCVEDYAALVRHRVEEIFPVDLLGKVCVDAKPNIPTGNDRTSSLFLKN